MVIDAKVFADHRKKGKQQTYSLVIQISLARQQKSIPLPFFIPLQQTKKLRLQLCLFNFHS